MSKESTSKLLASADAFPAPRSALIARASRAPGCLVEAAAGSIERREVEAFIAREYLEHFGARITHFMPALLGLREPSGVVSAAVGCRGAAAETLFLETYTRRPIEQALADRIGVDVPRAQIVEVGSLAALNGRAATRLILALIPHLIDAGFGWVVMTGADTVRNVFGRLRLFPHAICAADQRLLGADRDDWGTYYDHHPIVMAGRLADAVHALGAASRRPS